MDEKNDEAELTEEEVAAIDGVLDTFDAQSETLRVATFEALLATYCHECGKEQPDDPEEECPCAASDENEEEDEEDEDLDEEDEDLDEEDEEDEGDA